LLAIRSLHPSSSSVSLSCIHRSRPSGTEGESSYGSNTSLLPAPHLLLRNPASSSCLQQSALREADWRVGSCSGRLHLHLHNAKHCIRSSRTLCNSCRLQAGQESQHGTCCCCSCVVPPAPSLLCCIRANCLTSGSNGAFGVRDPWLQPLLQGRRRPSITALQPSRRCYYTFSNLGATQMGHIVFDGSRPRACRVLLMSERC
jgi:hypothetical protein